MKKVVKKSKAVVKKAKSPKLKSYTVQHEIELKIGVDRGELLLSGFKSSDPEEQKLLGDDGEYDCWDAAALVTDDELIFNGHEGPGGRFGFHGRHVQIIVPKSLIKKIRFETY